MKAAIFRKHGPKENLEITDIPIPDYSSYDVLVNVKAFALNRLDLWVRNGSPALKIPLPHIGGSDLAGIVYEIGSKVKSVNVGDRVLVNPGISCNTCLNCRSGQQSLCPHFKLLGEHVWGGAAKFAVVPETNILQFPENISFEEAAASPLTTLTAYRMLIGRAKIKPGEYVLIIGGGGGIGTMAVQIANTFGGKVIALTSSEQKEKVIKDLGAEFVINYKDMPNWGKEVWKLTNKKGVDIVVDSVGEVVWEQAVRSLAKGGRLVTCGATSGNTGKMNIALLFWKQLSILGSTMASNQEFIEAMQLVFSGKIKPIIDSVRPIEEIQDAHGRLESGEMIGKVVLTI